MSFRTTGFDGGFSRHANVSLGGKSRREEGRAEILERTRREREERRDLKARTKAATTIQAAWRAYLDVDSAKREFRDQYQTSLDALRSSPERWAQGLGKDLKPLAAFLLSADPCSLADVELLPAVAAAASAATRTPQGTDTPLSRVLDRRLVRLACAALSGACLDDWPRNADVSVRVLGLLQSLLAGDGTGRLVCQALEVEGMVDSLAAMLSFPPAPAPAAWGALDAALDAAMAAVLTRLLAPATPRGGGHSAGGAAPLASRSRSTFPAAALYPLLAVPGPWPAYPGVAATLPALVRHAAPGLVSASPALAAAPPAAAAAVLGNVLQGVAASCRTPDHGPSMFPTTAAAVAGVLDVLARRVAQEGLATQGLPPGVTTQLALLADPAVLSTLVRDLLWEEEGARPAASGATQLCALLAGLLAGSAPAQRQRLLLQLAVGTPFLTRLWHAFLQPGMQAYGLTGLAWPTGEAAAGGQSAGDPGWVVPLTVLAAVCSTYISTGDDAELYSGAFPLPLPELVSALRAALGWVLAGGDGRRPLDRDLRARGALVEATGKLLGQLYDRNGRREIVPSSLFHLSGPFALDTLAMLGEEGEEGGHPPPALGDARGRAATLLRYAPCLIPFQQRAEAFQRTVAREREAYRSSEESWQLRTGFHTPTFVPIRRGQVLADSFAALGGAGEELKGQVRVHFISDLGIPEAGVDGGGLFKEFLEEVVKEGFDPTLGLFAVTADQRLYPAPGSRATHPEALRLLGYLGRLLGKALLEGILVELPLATFFLQKLLGRACELRDLTTLDPELAGNLAKLRRYDADTLAALDVSFSITDLSTGDGAPREVELVRGGTQLTVTPANVIEYVHRVADYKLNRAIAAPAAAFVAGLHALVPPAWLAPFSAAEVQALISGGTQGLDLADLAAHVQYGGGYHAQHPVMLLLLQALASLTPAEQSLFLRFLAGSTIGDESQARLPTASTCMNLLKLPPYTSLETMLGKLRYAITAGAGFELS